MPIIYALLVVAEYFMIVFVFHCFRAGRDTDDSPGNGGGDMGLHGGQSFQHHCSSIPHC